MKFLRNSCVNFGLTNSERAVAHDANSKITKIIKIYLVDNTESSSFKATLITNNKENYGWKK